MIVQNPTAYVLTAYPLSDAFRKNVANIAGPSASYITVAALRKMKLRAMISFLRHMNKRAVLFIPLEDPESVSLFPLLIGLVALSSVGRIAVINADCTVKYTGRLEPVSALFRVAVGTLSGAFAALRCLSATTLLNRRSRVTSRARNESRKVLYINANYWFGIRVGGSVGHIAGVANALCDVGFEVDLASASTQPMLRPAIRQIFVKGVGAQGYPQELNFLRFHFRVLGTLKQLKSARYRFIYQRMSLFNFAGVALSRLWRIPLILEYNGSEVWIASNWGRPLRLSWLGAAIETTCLRHAHRVVVVSQPLADEVVSRGVDPDRVVCYPNCVDPTHFSPEAVPEDDRIAVRERLRLGCDATIVAFVGTFGRWHGAPTLAEAIKAMIDQRPDWLRRHKVRFAMIGDGGTMPAVKELIGSREYSEWVIFTGLVQQSETVKYLAACDVLVSPHIANADGSRFFGSPTKLFEYMAMGKGIVASDLDQIGEVLADGIRIWSDERGNSPRPTAILVRPGHIDDLVKGVVTLIENADLRKELGRNARELLLRRFTWRHHVVEILRGTGQSLDANWGDLACGVEDGQSPRYCRDEGGDIDPDWNPTGQSHEVVK